MIDLDGLKDAMESPPDFTPRSLDLGPVMAAGGRLRRRRRLVSAAAGGVAVLVLLVGGAQIAQHTGWPAQPNGGGAKVAAQPSTMPTPEGGLLGDVIGTGLRTGTDEWVFYAQPVNDATIPETHFGIQLGRRLPSGAIVGAVMANEASGSDRSPGFHAVQSGARIEDRQTPTFGYYVGVITKITAKAGGKTVTAKRALWSDDQTVTVFWFDPGAGALSNFIAYDKAGKAIPGGTVSAGHG